MAFLLHFNLQNFPPSFIQYQVMLGFHSQVIFKLYFIIFKVL